LHHAHATERDMTAGPSRPPLPADLPELPELPPPGPRDYLERNRTAWEHWAPAHIAAGRRAWQSDQLRWGLWGTPETELKLLDGFGPGDDALELGCGTGAVSASLAKQGMRPVAVDFALAQLRTAESLQQDFSIQFPLIRANAEEIPFDNESFDLAVSDYGASLWCDPRRWLPEAHRLLRPEGRLVFITISALLLTCTPADGGLPGDRLLRDYFSRFRVEFEPNGAVEFHLTHGQWIRLLRAVGFVIDDLVEVRPTPAAKPRNEVVSPEWAQRWPSEDIWVVHKT
jgi:SAM-dependent methyltransferase